MDTEQDNSRRFLPSLITRMALVGCRFPKSVIAIALLSCIFSLVYSSLNLTYQTHRNDLLNKKKDYFLRWQKYVDEFGDDDDMVVVVKGGGATRQRQIIEELAGRIQAEPQLFDRLFYKVDLRPLHDRALLFLPADQIHAIQEDMKNLALLLEPPVLTELDPLFGWKQLTIMQMLHEGERRIGALAKQASAGPDPLLAQLDTICKNASRVLVNPADYANPWQSVLPDDPRGRQDLLSEPQYFSSGDGQLAFLLTRPVKEKESFTYSQKSIDRMNAILADMRQKYTDVEMGLTGLPVLENDEMIASQSDSNFASWLALGGVAFLYLIVYRGIRYPFMTVSALLVGMSWSVGWLTLTVGHLNILSSAFAVMLIGMGDYGVLWLARYRQERRAHNNLETAMTWTAVRGGPSITTAALTTVIAFCAAMLADLKAVAELGWIAGSGVVLCALSCFLVMPALITLFDVKKETYDTNVISIDERRNNGRRWLPALMCHPYLVMSISGIACAVFGWYAVHVKYDHNLLHMQDQNLASVKWERDLIAHTAGTSWNAVDYTQTPEEALALKLKYEQLPDVSRVVELASLIPLDQERKLEQLRDLQMRLRKLPERGKRIPHIVPDVAELRKTGQRLLDGMNEVQTSTAQIAAVKASLKAFLATLSSVAPETAGPRLQAFEEKMASDLAGNLHQLRDVSKPELIRLADLPANLKERFISTTGKWLLRIYSKESLWEYEPLDRFVAEVRSVNPDATGKPFTTFEGLKAMRAGFLWSGFYALAAIALVLLFDFGSVWYTLLVLVPLSMGMIASIGFLALVGVPLNPANMIAFPLIIGVGVNYGVHVMHDYRASPKGANYHLSHAIGWGITIVAFTTILGFGTLMTANHRGLFSLGLALAVGVFWCMVTALIFLPAFLSVLSHWKNQEGSNRTLSKWFNRSYVA